MRGLKRVTAVAALVFLAGNGPWATAQGPTAQQPTAELVGRLELLERGGARGPARDTVVWVPGTTSRAPAPTITSREKRFTPRVVAVAPGATVTFPNIDSIFHNVFSRTPGNEFDLGLYRKGDSRTFRFANPGLVRVYCNIHPNMAAYVMVVEDAAFAVTGEDGAFRLRLPPGRRRVRVWNERAGEKEFALDLGPGEVKEWTAELDGTTYRRIQHQNKFGKDYPAATKDADRY